MSFEPRRRPRRGPGASRRRPARRCLATVALLVGTTVPALPAAPALAVSVPPVPAGLPRAIEPLPDLEPQTDCDPTPKPGVLAFRDLVLTTYPGTGSDGIVRACDLGAASEHKEGRAWDWALSSGDDRDRARARTFIAWLLGSDGAGHRAAMARRLGVMYVIWDGRIWSAARSAEGWRPYTGPEPHRDHVHFSFTRAGARGTTSYWSAPSPLLVAPYAGAVLRQGSTGPAVAALERALRLSNDGRYDASLRTAVTRWQRRQGLVADGVVGPASWRALRRSLTGPQPRLTLSWRVASAPAAPRQDAESERAAGSLPPARAQVQVLARTTVASGDRGAAVAVLQRALPGLPSTGWFGPRTRDAVVAFQRSQQLPADGVVGPATWQRIAASVPAEPSLVQYADTRLRSGDSGEAVQALQRVLRVAPASGRFGARTHAAVVQFQRRHRLPADGIVGPATWRALAF